MYNWFLSKATDISISVFLFNFGSMETAKVIRAFTCVNTRKHYKIGDEYEAGTDRIKHLADKGYVVVQIKVAHIPKAEVAAPIIEKAEIQSKPIKRKRNEPK